MFRGLENIGGENEEEDRGGDLLKSRGSWNRRREIEVWRIAPGCRGEEEA
jgi:hypothetical protein